MTARQRRTKTGRVLTDAALDALADEVASTGADVEALRTRRRGRPLVGKSPGEVVAVRMDPALRADLDAYAASQGKSLSAVVRSAVAEVIARNSESARDDASATR